MTTFRSIETNNSQAPTGFDNDREAVRQEQKERQQQALLEAHKTSKPTTYNTELDRLIYDSEVLSDEDKDALLTTAIRSLGTIVKHDDAVSLAPKSARSDHIGNQ
jgi:hypothetical protein